MPKRRSLRHKDKMKGSDGEVKGQGIEKRKVKTDEGSSTSSQDSNAKNPFLVEPILRKLLKKVDNAAQLKYLRKICVLWDKMNMEELEERALKGKLKAIDFEWKNRYPASSKKLAVEELVQFLKDTRSIPQLFRSFKFNIPESLKILQGHTSAFFSAYHIYGVELITPHNPHFETIQPALKYFLSLVGPNLKDIKMLRPTSTYDGSFEPRSPNWPTPEQELVLPKLEKLFIVNKELGKELTEFFKSILAREGSGRSHITSLALTTLPGADIGSFPGLDPTRLTRLDVGVKPYDIFARGSDGGFKGTSIALKYLAGLMTLVEKGMKLLDLGLKLDSGDDDTASFARNLPSICFNLSHFFATQSSTLTTLNLRLEFRCSWPGPEDEIGAEVGTYGKIQLPVFQALHTLSFHHRLEMGIANQNRTLAFSLLETTRSLPFYFPCLINMELDSECSMNIFLNNPDRVEEAGDSKIHLKRLEIGQPYVWIQIIRWNEESRGNWDLLYGSLIGSVDYLRVPSDVLEKVRIPWSNSIRELKTKYVRSPLKLSHLKKLETLVIEDYSRVGYKPYVQEPTGESYEDEDDWQFENHQEIVTEYLSWFSEAKQLNLTYIKFIGLRMENGIKEEFVRYFPFSVQFGKREEDYSFN